MGHEKSVDLSWRYNQDSDATTYPISYIQKQIALVKSISV